MRTVQTDAQGPVSMHAAAAIAPLAKPAENIRENAHTTLLPDVAAWLSNEMALHSPAELPRLAFVPSSRMIALRYLGIPSDHRAGGTGGGGNTPQPDIVAIYDDESRTIYLPEGWTGGTPAETSVLVHEMVHHIQNIEGTTFTCAETREEMAFAAQQRWLREHGTDLETEFELDPFTLLVRTSCPY